MLENTQEIIHRDGWYEDHTSIEENEQDEDEVDGFIEFNITASPNDFNIASIFSYMDKGFFKIPGFQRNYVWDLKRASKLIESILLGIPIPQIFLYEQEKNTYLVIDGQQRLMTIYYFIKGRFPRTDKRSELRKIFDTEGKIPDNIIADDQYFRNFNLQFSEDLPGKKNKLSGYNYKTLGDLQATFDFRTIRNIVVKQNYPDSDDSSIFELFNRLNTGGVNLKPQEIRTSLYHSNFYEMLYKINLNDTWRRLIKLDNPDLHMKDVEILLRIFALLVKGSQYKPSMTRFLNGFSKDVASFSPEKINYFESLFYTLMDGCHNLEDNAFDGKSGKFSFTLFESFVYAVCKDAYHDNTPLLVKSPNELIQAMKDDQNILEASQSNTASKANVDKRLLRAYTLYQEF